MKYIKLTETDQPDRVIGISANAKVFVPAAISTTEVSYADVNLLIKDESVEVSDEVATDTGIRENARAMLKQFVSSVRAASSGNADAATLSGWVVKAQRAQRYLDVVATESDVSLLTTEIELRGRGESLAELTTKIVQKAGLLSTLSVAVEAMASRVDDIVVSVDEANLVSTVLVTLKESATTQLGAIAKAQTATELSDAITSFTESLDAAATSEVEA